MLSVSLDPEGLLLKLVKKDSFKEYPLDSEGLILELTETLELEDNDSFGEKVELADKCPLELPDELLDTDIYPVDVVEILELPDNVGYLLNVIEGLLVDEMLIV